MKQHLHSKYYFYILLVTIYIIGFLIRIYRLSELMPFIGDQGWYYISARNMLLHGNIPLVGITASHIWLHQGAYWTYLLGGIFAISHFNPLAPGYFTAFMDSLTILLIYFVGSKLFSRTIGCIASVLYALSPLTIITSRMPYHTSLIPLLSTLFIFVFYQWLEKGVKYFPFLILMMGILYNFEIATSVFGFVIIGFIFYGFAKKQAFIKNLFGLTNISLSIIAFLVPMLPMIFYDTTHGYKQTVIFAGWTFYHILSVPFSFGTSRPHVDMGSYFLSFFQRLLFLPSSFIAVLLFLFSVLSLVYLLYKKPSRSMQFLLVGSVLPLLSIYVNKTPSDA